MRVIEMSEFSIFRNLARWVSDDAVSMFAGAVMIARKADRSGAHWLTFYFFCQFFFILSALSILPPSQFFDYRCFNGVLLTEC